jgi:hypothetical protein
MSTKAQVKTQAKTLAAPRPVHVGQPPVAVSEREADRPAIATQLEGASRLGHSLGAISVRSAAPSQIQAKPLIQRQELPEEEEEEELQTKPANGVQRQGQGGGFRLEDETASRINRARGGGKSLDGALQEQMSETMGHDFSGVRVHTDAQADELNQQLSAKAFTTGQDIFFKRGAYDPASSSGQELVTHELTHVVQQSTGRVPGSSRGMTLRPAADAFEQEADAVPLQRQRAGEQRPGAGGGTSGGVSRAWVVQRRGTYVPLSISRAGNVTAIEEQEYGQAEEVGFTPITSCIGFFGRKGDSVIGLHLGKVDAGGNSVDQVREELGEAIGEVWQGEIESVFQVGMTNNWELDTKNKVWAAVGYVGLGEDTDHEGNKYNARVKNGRLRVTWDNQAWEEPEM